MNGVIYARYSSKKQKEESIEGQLRECKAFAKRNDIHIGIGNDGFSRKDDDAVFAEIVLEYMT